MAKFGLYAVKSKDQHSLYNLLKYDNKTVSKTGKGLSHNYGVHSNNGKTLVDNTVVANTISKFGWTNKNDDLYSGQVSFTQTQNIEVNNQDYTELSKGNVPPGYKRFNPAYDYNINKVNLKHHEETNATFTKVLCPLLTLRPYTTRISPGKKITIPFFVDTFYMDSINRNEFHDTFTIIIEDSNGNVLYKKTKYAGEHAAVVGPFTQEGEDWFSVRAIDQDGCSSPTVFGQFLVIQEEPLNIYEFKETGADNDYDKYHITEGNLREQYMALTGTVSEILAGQVEINNKAFRNNLGLTKLFFDAKAAGYNCVKLPKDKYFEISYQINLATGSNRASINNLDGTIHTSATRYFKVKVDELNGKYYCTEVIECLWKDFDKECYNQLWKNYYSWDDELDEIVYPTGSISLLPRANRVTVTGSSGIPIQGQEVPKPTKGSADNSSNPQFNPAGGFGANGYNYFVYNPTGNAGVENVYMPDNFTLDMNGCTFKGYDPVGGTNFRGYLVYLIGNFNTHIKNGKIRGTFDEYNYHQRSLCVKGDPFRTKTSGTTENVPEGLTLFSFAGCRYCSYENMDMSYSIGYEGNFCAINYDETRDGVERTANNTVLTISDKSNRYIDLEGNVQPMSNLVDAESISESTHNIYDIFYMAVSNEIDMADWINRRQIRLLSAIHHGAQHHMFVACYDTNRNFIKLIKTQRFFNIRFPKNTRYIKVVVYGKPGSFNKNNFNAGGCWPLDPSGGVNTDLQLRAIDQCINCNVINVYWHDTGGMALHPEHNDGLLFEGCKWKNIDLCPSIPKIARYKTSDVFGDFEEGLQNIVNVTLRNCELLPQDPQYSVRASIGFHNVNTVNFIKTKGFSFKTSLRAVMHGIMRNNEIERLGYAIQKDYEHPQYVFRNNIINRMFVNTTGNPAEFYWADSYNNASTHMSNLALNKFNKIKVEKIITMTDTILENPFKYNNFNFHRVQDGLNVID